MRVSPTEANMSTSVNIPKDQKNVEQDTEQTCGGLLEFIVKILCIFIMIVTFPVSICMAVKVVPEYNRAVIYRLGRLIGAKGPGLFFIIPCLDEMKYVDLRVVSFDVPPQEILTKDSVTVSVDAVVYYKVFEPVASVNNISNAANSTKLLAQTTLRNTLGGYSLSGILSERDAITSYIEEFLDHATDPWGIKVQRVEIKDVKLPRNLQRAMAAEAEASREAKAKIIAAQGEMDSSKALKEAADIISKSEGALQLRYLQTLSTIAAEKNSTIIFPLPMDLLGKNK